MKSLITILFLFFTQAIYSQDYFQKVYATNGNEAGQYLDATNNDGFYLAGFTDFFDPG